jgi:hypothetical protein
MTEKGGQVDQGSSVGRLVRPLVSGGADMAWPGRAALP